MGIIQLPLPIAANSGVTPNIKTMTTTDNLATITAAAYLNSVNLEGYPVATTDELHVLYSFNPVTNVGTLGIFGVSISNGVITLVEDASTNAVTYTPPSIANHIAVFSNTTGNVADDAATAINGGNLQAGLSGTAGYLASFPATAAKGSLRVTAVANTGDTLVTLSNALHGQASVYSIPDSGASTANLILSKTTGTQHITVGSLQVDGGNLTAGISGAAGTLTSFPATAANGSLIVAALNAGGAFNTTIRNSAMAQSTVYSIPDVGASTGFIVANATQGLMKSVTAAAAAGGAAAQSFTDAFCTTTSTVVGNWNTQANAASVLKIVPGNGSFVVTSSADAGVGTFAYIIMK